MTPEEVRGRLGRLREAGAKLRRRPARETLEALAALLDQWCDPSSAPRRRLAEDLPPATGFAPATLAAGLELGLEHWTGDALRELVARELGGVERLDAPGAELVSGFDTTAVILAGAIPMPSLLALVAPLVLRSPVLVKCASRDPVTPREVAHSIAGIDPELGGCVEVVELPGSDDAGMRALLGADCVVATGSDATIAAVRARVAPPRRLVCYGHRVSLAVLGPEPGADVAARLALDVALWDQLGCLSPIGVYAMGGDGAADRVAEELHRALGALEARLPRGEIDRASAAASARERAEAEMRMAAGRRVVLHAGATHTVVREDDAAPRSAPRHRFVRVHPVADPADLAARLAPLAPHLAGVALEGFDAGEERALVRSLADLGASRLCRPGDLQRPLLAWRHDNRGVLLPAARLTDAEIVSTT